MLLPNCPDFVARFFGAISLGALAAPLDPGFRLPELIEALRGCTLGAIVACDATAEVATDLAAHFRDAVPVLHSDLELRAATGASRAEREAVPAGADALLGFSSGTTGPARRFARSQDNLVQEASSFAATFGMGPQIKPGVWGSVMLLKEFDVRGAMPRFPPPPVSKDRRPGRKYCGSCRR